MNPIEENAMNILVYLTEKKLENVSGNEINDLTGLSPEDINDAIEHLESLGAADVMKTIGTAPYGFYFVNITSRGRYLYHEMKGKTNEIKQIGGRTLLPKRPLNPVGSPYGFTDDDWEFVSLKKGDMNTLNVVFGLQYKSQHYNTDHLIKNIREHVEEAIKMYNEKHPKNKIESQFEKLTAGYGEHLFNTIARSIISSDIAIFEVSDQNPNVMIELGVALTWGVRILPIRDANSPKPPSDISGHTWIEHRISGEEILDEEFLKKLIIMIERAIAKKGVI